MNGSLTYSSESGSGESPTAFTSSQSESAQMFFYFDENLLPLCSFIKSCRITKYKYLALYNNTDDDDISPPSEPACYAVPVYRMTR